MIAYLSDYQSGWCSGFCLGLMLGSAALAFVAWRVLKAVGELRNGR